MRVLIIEDDENIANYLRRSLRAEGFCVDVASDGAAGFDRALEGGYDAITLDVIMPKMITHSNQPNVSPVSGSACESFTFHFQ